MGWVAHVIIVSAQGPNPSFFLFLGTFIRLGGLLGPGLGPGLDNYEIVLNYFGWMGGPCDYCVSPRSKSLFFSFFGGLLFDLGACWDQDLDQGLTTA